MKCDVLPLFLSHPGKHHRRFHSSATNSEMEKLGIKPGLSIMDAGFFSENNIRSMMDKKIYFLMRAPANRKIHHDLVESTADIENLGKLVKYGNRIMFISSSRIEFADHSVYTYPIPDPERRGRELRRYMLKHMDDYDPFAVKRKGFMVLMSSQSIERDQFFPPYYTGSSLKKHTHTPRMIFRCFRSGFMVKRPSGDTCS